jgi:hypothetical protein
MFSATLDLSAHTSLDEIFDALYEVFQRDFIEQRTYLNEIVYINPHHQGVRDGKEETFWHIVTRKDNKTKVRKFDDARAQRIEWIKRIIDNHVHAEVKCFYYFERDRKIRFYLWAHNHDFLVILQKLGATESYIVTSFFIDNERKRNKTQKKFEDYIGRKDNRLLGCEWF